MSLTVKENIMGKCAIIEGKFHDVYKVPTTLRPRENYGQSPPIFREVGRR